MRAAAVGCSTWVGRRRARSGHLALLGCLARRPLRHLSSCAFELRAPSRHCTSRAQAPSHRHDLVDAELGHRSRRPVPGALMPFGSAWTTIRNVIGKIKGSLSRRTCRSRSPSGRAPPMTSHARHRPPSPSATRDHFTNADPAHRARRARPSSPSSEPDAVPAGEMVDERTAVACSTPATEGISAGRRTRRAPCRASPPFLRFTTNILVPAARRARAAGAPGSSSRRVGVRTSTRGRAGLPARRTAQAWHALSTQRERRTGLRACPDVEFLVAVQRGCQHEVGAERSSRHRHLRSLQCRLAPSRVNVSCGNSLISTYRSPAGPPRGTHLALTRQADSHAVLDTGEGRRR